MTDAFKQQIQAEARQAAEELLEQAKLKKGDFRRVTDTFRLFARCRFFEESG